MLIGGQEPKRSKDFLNLVKKSLWIIVGILNGHCSLNYHLGKLGRSTDSACRFCEETDETSRHVQGQCPAFAQNRFRHLGEYLVPDARLKHLHKTRKYLKIPIGHRSDGHHRLNKGGSIGGKDGD